MEKTAKQLIITGFPCPIDAWQVLFPSHENQAFLPLSEILANSKSARFHDLAKYTAKKILEHQPTLIILHDFGVILGLLALIRLYKKQGFTIPKVVVFNGAFRGFNVLKSRHPFKIVISPISIVSKLTVNSGGKIDNALKHNFTKVRLLYLQVILASLTSTLKALFTKQKKLNINIGSKLLLIASQNDPYIPYECMEQIKCDFANTEIIASNYGHFPYNGNIHEIRQLVNQFKNETN